MRADLGYRVRGTVRSLKKKTEHLTNLVPGAAHRLELVEADLTSDAGWAEAVAGCDYIMHVASPFPLQSPRDPERELYIPAREGTLRVLRAAAAASPRPRRVVLTSSTAAIAYGHDDTGRDPTKPFTDDEWTVLESRSPSVGPYIRSKTMAERAGWEYVRSLPSDRSFELVAVNPTTVIGPVYGKQECTSGEIVALLLNRGMPAVPQVGRRPLGRPHLAGRSCAMHRSRWSLDARRISPRRFTSVASACGTWFAPTSPQ